MNLPDGIILSTSGKSLTPQEKNFFRKTNPLGFVLFSRNYSNKEQIIRLIKELKNISKNKLVKIFIDQEGGRVQRFNKNGFTIYPPQNIFQKIYENEKKKAKKLSYLLSYLLASELKDVGVDVNFSPVCDLHFEFGDSIIGDRSFGSNPLMVKELSLQYCNGFRASGILPVLKHFPGHGRSLVDTHKNSSTINTNINILWKNDFVPFKNLKNQSLMMLAHIIFKEIDDKVATYSAKINKLIRNKFLFKGLIITDDISMKALDDDLVDVTKNSYNAGCDVILHCNGEIGEMKKIYPDFFLNDILNLKIKKHSIKKTKEILSMNSLIE